MTGQYLTEILSRRGEECAYNCALGGISGVLYYCSTLKSTYFFSNHGGYAGENPANGTKANSYMGLKNFMASKTVTWDNKLDFNVGQKQILPTEYKHTGSPFEQSPISKTIIIEFDTFVSVNQNF